MIIRPIMVTVSADMSQVFRTPSINPSIGPDVTRTLWGGRPTNASIRPTLTFPEPSALGRTVS